MTICHCNTPARCSMQTETTVSARACSTHLPTTPITPINSPRLIVRFKACSLPKDFPPLAPGELTCDLPSASIYSQTWDIQSLERKRAQDVEADTAQTFLTAVDTPHSNDALWNTTEYSASGNGHCLSSAALAGSLGASDKRTAPSLGFISGSSKKAWMRPKAISACHVGDRISETAMN